MITLKQLLEDMIQRKEEDVVQKLFTVELESEAVAHAVEIAQPRPQRVVMSHGDDPIAARPGSSAAKREADKVGRNDPCPCGSGRKYKRCHGK